MNQVLFLAILIVGLPCFSFHLLLGQLDIIVMLLYLMLLPQVKPRIALRLHYNCVRHYVWIYNVSTLNVV